MIAIVRPSAEGTYTAWVPSGSSDKAVDVDPGNPISHDENTTFIYAEYTLAVQSFYMNVGVPSVMLAVNSLTLTARCYTPDTPVTPWYQGVRIGTTNGSNLPHTPTNSYADGVDASVARPGGGAWVPTDFATNNFQTFVYVDGSTGNIIRCTSLWVYLDYQPAAGGFLMRFFTALGPLACVALNEIPAMARHVLRKTSQLIEPHEYRQAWQELRDHRYPHLILAPAAGWR